MADQIELVYKSFLNTDVSIENFLCVELDKDIDNKKFSRLQIAAQNAKKGDSKPVDDLADFIGHMPSPLTRERLIAFYYNLAGFYDKALEWGIKALEVAPKWDLDAVSNILNIITWNLNLLGRNEKAKYWGNKAILYNPYFPYTIGTLTELHGSVNEYAIGQGFYLYLKNNNFGSHCWGNYIPKTSGDFYEYKPNLRSLTKLTDNEVYKTIVSQQHFANRPDEAKSFNLSLSLAAAGRYVEAIHSCQLLDNWASDTFKIQTSLLANDLKNLIPEDLFKTITSKKEIFSNNPDIRIKALKKLKEKDKEKIWYMVFDPVFDVSMHACEKLLEMGVRDELSFYLDLAKEMEYKTGKSILHGGAPKPYHLSDISGNSAVSQRGVEMIEKIITGIENGTSHIKIPIPQPIEKGKLEKLMIDKGVTLPPSLKRFLEFDASWLATDYGLFDDLENPEFQPVSVAEALRDGLMDENFWQSFKKLPKPLPQAKCIPLDCGCETMRILFLGKPDKNGEYAVLDLDIDDMPSIYLAASSFDIWLARQAGLISDPSTECKKDMDDCAKRLFGKADWLECDYDENEDEEDEDEFDEDEDEENEDEDEENEDDEDEKPTYTKKSVKGMKFSPEQLAKLDRDKMIKAMDNASENNDADTAWVLYEEIKKRFKKDQKCLDGALVVCGFNDFAQLIKPLLDIGANANAEGHYGSVLSIACVGRSFEIFKILVDAGANVNWSKKEEDSPIASAAEHKNVDKVKYLLEHGAKPTPNALYEAISQFHKDKIEKTIEIVTLLLNADPQLANNGINNWYPIIKAVNERNLEIVKLLIERGADPNGSDYKSSNALQEAWSLNVQDIFDYLLTTKVSRTHKNEQGWSIDDLFDETCKYPKIFNVNLYETEKEQHISLKLKYIFRNPYQVDFDHVLDAIKFIERLVNGGLAGSDKYAPDSAQFEWKSKLPKEKKEPVDEIKVEFVVKGICESTFNIWLLEFFNQDFGIAELELVAHPIANEKIVIDTEKAKKWLDTKKPAPIKSWPAIPFSITEAMANGRICMFQHEGKPNDQALYEITCLTREIISDYEVKVIKGKYGNEIMWVDYKQSGKKTIFEHRFLIGSKNKAFNCDMEVTRAIVLNALIRYHKTNPIQSLEWSLGITGKVSELTAEKVELETYGDEDKIEVSPSARAACKGCKQKIDKGILRFAYTNEFFQQSYFHLECAGKKHGERLKASIEKFEGEIPNKQDLLTQIDSQKATPKKAATVSGGTYPYAELAKTSRSKCIKCGQTIEKDTLRIAVEREFEIPTGGMMTGAGYLHIGCAKDYEGVILDHALSNSPGLGEAEKKVINGYLK